MKLLVLDATLYPTPRPLKFFSPSTSISMQPSSPTADFIKKVAATLNVKTLLVFCIVIFSISAVITSVVYNHVMLAGHSTSFSLSEPRLGFQKGPASRGTLNLVWASFSTIFTCIYVSLHLDIPSQSFDKDSQEGETQGSLWCWLKKPWHWLEKQMFFRKVVWMGVNLVLPEALTGFAFWEYRSARAGVKYMESKGVQGWTLTHAFFADMGGLNILEDGRADVRVLHSGVDFYKWFEEQDRSIDFDQLLLDINDRSNADPLLKAYTCVQASWFVVQTIVRAIEHRPVSELEITTCAYVMCTVAAYIFWWHKPKDIRQPIILYVDRPARPGACAPRAPSLFERLRDWMRRVFRLQAAKPSVTVSRELGQAVPGHRSWPLNRYCGIKDVKWIFGITGIVGAGIGVIHCGLWNAQFINSNGQLLWRICCCLQIVTPLIEALQPLLPRVSSSFHIISLIIAGSAFSFARIVTVLLIILSFRSLPAGVYTDVDWTWSAFPHWH